MGFISTTTLYTIGYLGLFLTVCSAFSFKATNTQNGLVYWCFNYLFYTYNFKNVLILRVFPDNFLDFVFPIAIIINLFMVRFSLKK